VPRWTGTVNPAAADHWTGTDGTTPSPTAPEINDITQLLDAVALGNAVAYVPISFANDHRRPDVAFVPVTDLGPSELMAAWPTTSRSRAIAGFVRAAVEVARLM
jgi:DNA-binding transcriptional LysR family regulator